MFLLSVVPSMALHAQYNWQEAFPSLPSFSLPLELVRAYDGTNRFFVVQQRGLIYVFESAPTVSARKVFLNVTDSVSQSGSETGLLGLAFHPNYASNGYFYVNHTNTVGGQLRTYIARYKVSASNPDSADKASRFVLMTIDQPFSNHNGGKIAFGPDGYLYIGTGDGGSANDPGNRAQNRSVLLGKVLRINVDSMAQGLNYAIPPSNPYYGNTEGYREEVYAYGIRNPWKFSFDPVTDRLWLGDVGQDSREEVDIIVSGGNYGWRLMEGSICNPVVNPGCQDTAGLIRPVWDYPNAGSDISITGGYVYRGSAIPSLYGKYIFADYGSGKTWILTYEPPTPASAVLISDESNSISSFGVDTSNNLYYVAYGAGRILRLNGPGVGVAQPGTTPAGFALEQNYPNPFNPVTTIIYRVVSREFVELKVFDLLGREVTTLVNEAKLPGTYQVLWDARDFPSGVYLCRMRAGAFLAARKIILAK